MSFSEAEGRCCYAGRHVLVTGATGFIGRHLSERLVVLGANVMGLSRHADVATVPHGVKPVRLDLSIPFVTTGLDQFDYVFHLAGRVTGARDRALVMPMIADNVIATAHLLNAAADLHWGRIVLASSSEQGAPGSPPTSPYAASKAAAAALGRMYRTNYGVPVIEARLFLSYGPLQPPEKLVPTIVRQLAGGQTIVLREPYRICDAIYVDDAVSGLLRVGAFGEPGPDRPLDIGSGDGTRVLDVGLALARLMRVPDSAIIAQPGEDGRTGDCADLAFTSASIGWTPQWSLESGLKATLRWLKRQ